MHMSTSRNTTLWIAMVSGLTGALVLTAIHEGVRQVRRDAPRMDLVGRRGLARLLRKLDLQRLSDREMYLLTLAGDISSNALYYAALLTKPEAHVFRRAALGGGLAGAGALVLPTVLDLGESPREQRVSTRVMTVAWYTLGALAGAIASRLLTRTASHR
jgi:hypothetical protein